MANKVEFYFLPDINDRPPMDGAISFGADSNGLGRMYVRNGTSDALVGESLDNLVVYNTIKQQSSKVIGDKGISLGVDCSVGAKAYYFTSATIEDGNYVIYLASTRDGSDIPNNTGYSVGDPYSIHTMAWTNSSGKQINGHQYDFAGTITSIDGNKIVVSDFPEVMKDTANTNWVIQDEDDALFYVPTKPHLGVVFIGDNSVSFGENNKVAGRCSVSFGRDNIVGGDYSTNFGRGNTVGYGCLVAGRDNVVTSNYSFGAGNHIEVTGDRATGIGYEVKSKGNYGVSIGYKASVEKDSDASASIGCESSVSGVGDIALNAGKTLVKKYSNESGSTSNYFTYNFAANKAEVRGGTYNAAFGTSKITGTGAYNVAFNDAKILSAGSYNVAFGTSKNIIIGGVDTPTGIISGTHSFVAGQNNRSTHDYCFTANYQNQSLNIAAATFGGSNKNAGYCALVGGESNNVTGKDGFTVGNGNTVSAENASVSGTGNTVSGNKVIVGGNKNNVTGQCSIVGGDGNTVGSKYALVVGQNITKTLNYVIMGGYNTKASGNGDASIVQGQESESRAYCGIAVGQGALTISGTGEGTTGASGAAAFGHYNKGEKLFEIGNGTSKSRSNAFSVDGNGNTIISGTLTIAGNTIDGTFWTGGSY